MTIVHNTSIPALIKFGNEQHLYEAVRDTIDAQQHEHDSLRDTMAKKSTLYLRRAWYRSSSD